MPHQCIRCNAVFPDDAREIARGCTCGGKLFFYVKPAKLKEAKQLGEQLTLGQKEAIEEDVADVVGHDADDDEALVLDLESIRQVAPGKYELDLQRLLNGEKLVYKLGDGEYGVDLAKAFKELKKK